MKVSQKKIVLAHLQRVGSITPKEAMEYFNCYRLADVVFKLRKDGWVINSNPTKGSNGSTFSTYTMEASC